MDVIASASGFRAAADARRARDDTVGFVPTMGALHAGHASLIRRARDDCAAVAVSVFVNPEQFGPNEDFAAYPRDEHRDIAACEEMGVDLVFVPPEEEIYPTGIALIEPEPGAEGEVLEGASRPGHFRGVLKAVHRLFDLAGPCNAYFGEKDAQQLFLVRRMVSERGLPVNVVGCPTVRESDGLAVSSRNAFLSTEEREQAGCLFLGLSEAAALARKGERDTSVLVAAIAREVGATPLAKIDYAAVVDDRTFEQPRMIEGFARALVAVRFPGARLIDNLALPTGG